MEITKEQIKRLAKAVKAMQEETLIDDDVSGGYQPDPFKGAYAEIYTVIDECERGLNIDTSDSNCNKPHVSNNEVAVCPYFNECINNGKNEHCDLQTFQEIDCFIGQTER